MFNSKVFVAEFIGTFALVFIGAGAEMVVVGRGEGLAKGAISFCAGEGWYIILNATITTKAVNFIIS